MSSGTPLMPKATAVWLVDNTSLTFEQIAEFCGMHILEIKGIADGDVGQGIRGKNPVTAGELTRDDISTAEEDADKRLKLITSKVKLPEVKAKKRPRYTPVSRRQDRPNAVVWLLRHHPELKDSQIIRLVGTTKPTIQQVRDRSHWNSANLVPQDPVTLGLCKQTDLDLEVDKATKRKAKERAAAGLPPLEPAGTLLPTAETTDYALPTDMPAGAPAGTGAQPSFSAASVFADVPPSVKDTEESDNVEEAARVLAKLQGLGSESEDEEESAGEEDVAAALDSESESEDAGEEGMAAAQDNESESEGADEEDVAAAPDEDTAVIASDEAEQPAVEADDKPA